MDGNSIFYYMIMCGLDVGKVLVALLWIIGLPGILTKRKIVFSAGGSMILIAVFYRYIDAVYLPIFYLLIVLWNVQIMMKLKNVARFLLTVISFLCICEIDYFTGTLIRLLAFTDDVPSALLDIGISLIGFISWYIVAYTCHRNDISFYKDREIKNSVFIAVEILILFVNISIVGIMFGILSEDTTHKAVLLLLAAMLMTFVISVVSLLLYCSVTSAYRYKKLHEMNTAYLTAQKEHFEIEKQRNLDSRKFQHDIANHLVILNSLIESENYSAMKSYLKEVNGRFNQIQTLIRTGNDIVDAIVNEKIKRAVRYDSEIQWEGSFPQPLIISDFDICTILANGLDNAIEACAKIKEHCIIKCLIASHEEFLRILIENPIAGIVNLRSRKRNKRQHGFGIENITECVKRNGGEIQIITEDETFALDILVRAYDLQIKS